MFKHAIEQATIVVSFLIQHLRYRAALPAEFKPQKILVVKLDHLGDVLLSTPVFSNLRHAYPKAQIHALVGSWGIAAVRELPHIDTLIEYNAPFFCRSGSPTRLPEAFRLLRRLRKEKYSLLVDLRGNWLTAYFALLKSVPYRLDLASLQVKNKVGRTPFSSAHEVQRNLDVLRLTGIMTPCTTPTFHTGHADRKWADDFLDDLNVIGDRPLIALHPGSPIMLKRWHPERFAELADWIIERKAGQVIFVGVASELPIVREIKKKMRQESINIAGMTTISQLAEILRRCDLFIGNDSGPMHLSAAVGIPTIGLYGPGNPERFGPVGAHCQTIRRKPDCPPCMSTACRFDAEGCMKEITVAEVIETVDHCLGKR